MSKNSLYFGLFLVTFVAIITAIAIYKKPTDPYAGIKSFDDCVKAGNPVTQGYPRQCNLKNGKFFTETLMAKECLSDKDCSGGDVCQNHLCQAK